MYPESVTLTRAEIELLKEPWAWHHDFLTLGFKTFQRQGDHCADQAATQEILFRFIAQALALSRLANSGLRGVELFCKDGFYGIYAAQQGAQSVRGLAFDLADVAHARLAAKILGLDGKLFFDCGDISKLDGEYDFGICAGGLDQLSDPGELLRMLAQKVRGPLVIQSVISMARTDPDYFQSPAPRQAGGCRFSCQWLQRAVRQSGWEIVEFSQNELEGKKSASNGGSACLLCVPLSYIQSDLAKPAGQMNLEARSGLWDQPNKFARPPGIECGDVITLHGYQEFQIGDGAVSPLASDPALRRKQKLVRPYFRPEFLEGKDLLDLGANGGFFSFWACQAKAKQVTSLDMDEAYLSLIRRAQTLLGWRQIRAVHALAQDWEEPADMVLAFAMIHWLYSCTATFGSLDAAVVKLANLTRLVLLIEWVDPKDTAIASFKHTDWNPQLARGPYNLDAFETALRRHFHKVEVIGPTSATRTLYAAWKKANEIVIDPALPLLAPVERVLYSRSIPTSNGVTHYSRVYASEKPDVVIKQASGDLAMHEAESLRHLSGRHFPRVISAEQRAGYSVLMLERVQGSALAEAIPEIAASPRRLAAFMNECLAMLNELRAAGIQHRDIRLPNLMAREGLPVLIDFGWSQAHGKPYQAPWGAGDEDRIPSGPQNDLYSMGKVFQRLLPERSRLFAPLLGLMLTPSLARSLSVDTLAQVLNGLELPEKWDVPAVFPAAVKPETSYLCKAPSQEIVRQPYLRRTWLRWQKSFRKRFGRRRLLLLAGENSS